MKSDAFVASIGVWQKLGALELGSYRQKKLICDVNNIASHAILHNSSNVLVGELSSIKVVKKVRFVDQEAKDNTCWYFETVKKGVDLAFFAQFVVEGIAVKIVEFRDVSL